VTKRRRRTDQKKKKEGEQKKKRGMKGAKGQQIDNTFFASRAPLAERRAVNL
jgi:hypothetical protein